MTAGREEFPYYLKLFPRSVGEMRDTPALPSEAALVPRMRQTLELMEQVLTGHDAGWNCPRDLCGDLYGAWWAYEMAVGFIADIPCLVVEEEDNPGAVARRRANILRDLQEEQQEEQQAGTPVTVAGKGE